jgi:hypothetical protein
MCISIELKQYKMRVLKVKSRLKVLSSGHEFFVDNVLVLGKDDHVKGILNEIYDPKLFRVVSFDFENLGAVMGRGIYDINNINFPLLSKQKTSLINMIGDWESSDDVEKREQASDVEGILNLIDYIQDYATDVKGIPQKEVFPNLEKDAEEFGEALLEMDELAFHAWLKGEEPLEGDEFYNRAPRKIKDILDTYNEDAELYQEAQRVVEELEEEGYTAEYGLDGTLYGFKTFKQ